MAVKVYILVVTEPGSTKRVLDALSRGQNAVEAHEVLGPYDIVLEIEVANLADIPAILNTQVRTVPGITSTTSLVSFPDQA